jgi:protein tyrosine/serine phosphatase
MNKNRIIRLGFVIATLSVLGGIAYYCPACRNKENTNASSATATSHQREAEANLPGVPNFHKVSEDLYRGAQPTQEGFRELEKLGIKTVVNLRSSHSDKDLLKGTNFSYEHIPMTAWHPEQEDAVRFLKIVTDANRTPVFVHCRHGADRTGTMCAIYHIAVQGWSKDQAIEEMTKGDFGFHGIFENLVNYIRGLDIEEIKQQAGINH